MSTQPIHLAFIWHIHQPWYVDPVTEESLLPWVRMHATSAYSDMAELFEQHPDIHATVAISPSLLDQLERYADGGADSYQRLTAKAADALDADERLFLLQRFYSVHWGRIVEAVPRYRELLEKRGRELTPARWREAAASFTTEELRDLQLLFNLTWYGIDQGQKQPIADLLRKGRHFSESDKALVLEHQRDVMRGLVPRWRLLMERGSLEALATPYYHAILPLLMDSNCAKRANPEVTLPERFSHPEDAETQLRRGLERAHQALGTTPAGLWPAEGAISPELVRLASACGVRYLASDASILFHSLDDRGSTPGRRRLYQPYRLGDTGLVFRDAALSAKITREYSRYDDATAAAHDFVAAVMRAGEQALPDGDRPPLVVVALDGENPWESYPRRGHDFLHELYCVLEQHERIQTVTLGEHLQQHPPSVALDYLNSGSWIEGNFDIWIGDPEKNKAWNLLGRARAMLTRQERSGLHGEEQLQRAREHLLRAECSDWFWWLGEPFTSAEDSEFELLFLHQVRCAYEALGLSPPADVAHPIAQGGVVAPLRDPSAPIHPRIDGSRTSFYEWRGAGFYRGSTRGAGARRGALPLIAGLYWGFDAGRLYLRLDPMETLAAGAGALHGLSTQVELTTTRRQVQALVCIGPEAELTLSGQWDGEGHDLGRVQQVAYRDVLELAIPLSRMGFEAGARLGLSVRLRQGEQLLEELPPRGVIEVRIPEEELEG